MPGREIVLIDLGSCYWAAWHSSTNDEVSAAHDRAVNKVRQIASQHHGAHVAVCIDSPLSWRRDVAPSYKAQRPAKDHASIEQLVRTQDTLRKDGFLLWGAPRFEADDMIATAAMKARRKEDHVTIYSADKDLLQLVSDPVCIVITTSTGTRMDEAAVLAKHGVLPEKMADSLAICGDKSDNIAGVPGVGPVGAAKLLATYGTIEALMAATERPDQIATPAVDKAIRASVEAMTLAKRLVTLSHDAPLNYDELFEAREVQPLTGEPGDYDMENADDALDLMGPEIQPQPAPPKVQSVALATTEPPAEQQAQAEPSRGLASMSRSAGLQPQTLDAAFGFSKAILNSRLYARYSSQEAIFAVIVRGSEMGLGALTSLDNFHVIDGKPCPGAHLLIARAMAHPDCEYFAFVEGDERSATYETKHRNNPKPTRLTYTFEQAKIAGFKPGSAWEKRTPEMLRKACGVQLGRIVYPSAIQGLYSAEEMGGES